MFKLIVLDLSLAQIQINSEFLLLQWVQRLVKSNETESISSLLNRIENKIKFCFLIDSQIEQLIRDKRFILSGQTIQFDDFIEVSHDQYLQEIELSQEMRQELKKHKESTLNDVLSKHNSFKKLDPSQASILKKGMDVKLSVNSLQITSCETQHVYLFKYTAKNHCKFEVIMKIQQTNEHTNMTFDIASKSSSKKNKRIYPEKYQSLVRQVDKSQVQGMDREVKKFTLEYKILQQEVNQSEIEAQMMQRQYEGKGNYRQVLPGQIQKDQMIVYEKLAELIKNISK